MAAPSFSADLWLFVGQSNMKASTQLKGINEVRTERKQGKLASVSVQKDGRPISYFLPTDAVATSNKKALKEAGTGWAALEKLAAAQGQQIAGMVYYQGESDGGSTRFGQDLALYFSRVRELLGKPTLPIVLVQLGPRHLPDNKSEDRNAQFGMGVTRELQRRVGLADAQVEVVAACDLPLVDDRVHLTGEGQRLLGRRIAAAMDILHGRGPAGCGPVPVAAWRDGNAVMVRCERVQGRLVLAAGWDSGFSLAGQLELPDDPSTWPSGPERRERLPDLQALMFPTSAEVVEKDMIRLQFAHLVAEGSRLSWAGTLNSQVGPNPRPVDSSDPGLSRGILGLTDESGHTAVAALFLPVLPRKP